MVVDSFIFLFRLDLPVCSLPASFVKGANKWACVCVTPVSLAIQQDTVMLVLPSLNMNFHKWVFFFLNNDIHFVDMVLQTKHHQLLLIAVNISFLLSHAERPSYAPPPPPAPTTVSVHHSVSGSVLSLYWPQGHDRLSTLFLVPFIFLSYCLISSFSMFDIVFIKFLPLSEHTEVATSLYGSPSSLSVLLFPGLSPLTKGLVQKGLTWLMSFGKATEEFLFNIKFQNLALVYSNRSTCFGFPYIQQQGKALCKV